MTSPGVEPAPAEREKRLLRVEVERVPTPEQVTAEQWEEWCAAHGMRTLGPTGRRAWIDQLSTYLRGAEYLVFHDGALIDICDEDSLLPTEKSRRRRWRRPASIRGADQ